MMLLPTYQFAHLIFRAFTVTDVTSTNTDLHYPLYITYKLNTLVSIWYTLGLNSNTLDHYLKVDYQTLILQNRKMSGSIIKT